MTDPRLFLTEVDVPEPFRLKYTVPIWQENTLIFFYPDLQDFVFKNFNQYKVYPGEIGIPNNYVRWNSYNLFNLDLPCSNILKENIKQSYLNFAQVSNFIPKEKLWVTAWINIIEKNVGIPRHFHSAHINSYITGFISLGNNNTEFYYPEHITCRNQEGSITLFPSWLFHEVLPISENLRVSIGFDLFTEDAVNFYNSVNANKEDSIKYSIRLI
jgi:hypothetical protein